MRRGDLVTVAAPGDYGKPRPALVVQSDWLNDTDSVLVCLLTSTLRDAPIYRMMVEPSPGNGLKAPSQVMVDKVVALPRAKCGPVVGHLEPAAMTALGQLLSVVLGLAD